MARSRVVRSGLQSLRSNRLISALVIIGRVSDHVRAGSSVLSASQLLRLDREHIKLLKFLELPQLIRWCSLGPACLFLAHLLDELSLHLIVVVAQSEIFGLPRHENNSLCILLQLFKPHFRMGRSLVILRNHEVLLWLSLLSFFLMLGLQKSSGFIAILLPLAVQFKLFSLYLVVLGWIQLV